MATAHHTVLVALADRRQEDQVVVWEDFTEELLHLVLLLLLLGEGEGKPWGNTWGRGTSCEGEPYNNHSMAACYSFVSVLSYFYPIN